MPKYYFDGEVADEAIEFHFFKDRFLRGFDCAYNKEWVAACEQYVIEFGDIECARLYDDVIERLSDEYRRRNDKKHLRRYLCQRLQKDLGI
jgi:hypothetical protein